MFWRLRKNSHLKPPISYLMLKTSVRASLYLFVYINKNGPYSVVPLMQIMEPPWKAYNVLRKMEYPYEVIMPFFTPSMVMISKQE